MDRFRDGVSSAWATTAAFSPKLAAFLLILLAGYILARVLSTVLDRVLETLGFREAVERGGVGQVLAVTGRDAASLPRRVMLWTVMLLVLQLALGVFGRNPVGDLLHGVISYLPKLLAAMVIVVAGAAIATGARETVEARIGQRPYGRPLAVAAGTAVWSITAFAALDELEIAPKIVTALFAALLALLAGSAILAIGGGGISTLERLWERAAARLEPEPRAAGGEDRSPGCEIPPQVDAPGAGARPATPQD